MSNPAGEAKQTGFEIAVIGMAGRFPKAPDLTAFWRNIRDRVECLTEFSDEQLLAAGVGREWLTNPRYVRRAGVLEDAQLFDAAFFGITPREAEAVDPQQRIFLECASEALEDAGYDPEAYAARIGVFAGAGRNAYLLLNLLSRDPEEALSLTNMLASDSDYLTTRVSYKLNLRGPSVNVQTACSTSLVAVHVACQSLLVGECEMALAGGISLRVPQEIGYLYQEGGNLAPDGYCRAFDERAGGMVGASGVGIVVLKRLSDALADRDTIRAVIKGSAINNDGSGKVGFTAPRVDGQAEVIRQALRQADVHPDSIGYVEAHGTGTVLGDPIEIAGLTKAFRKRTARKGFCAIGSLKASIGHTDAAAGVAGLIKTVLALQHRVLPPSLNFERPNPNIDFANSPFYVNTTLREWPDGATPRRAGVSSFGLGGTNAHAVLEEAPAAPVPAAAPPWQLLVLAARTRGALDQATIRLRDRLRQPEGLALADVAFTLQAGRRRFPHRRYLVCRSLEEAAEILDDAAGQARASGGAEDGRNRRWTRALASATQEQGVAKRAITAVEERVQRPIAFLFPGQGAQYVNMGRDLYEGEAVFRTEVDSAAQALTPLLGRDLRALLYPDPAQETEATEELRRTCYTQPALFVIEHALARLWMSWGVQPAVMIGHSIGEYVAACLAGVFSLEDALHLVARRGRLMQELPPGAMVSVRLPADRVHGLLEEGLSIAALNEEAATVVSGECEAVRRLEARLDSDGVAHQRLQTSHAFHSSMMDPILEEFTDCVRRVERREPRIPYVSNLTGTWITAATDPAYWARHLREPVRFTQGLTELFNDPERLLLEVGPGRTLSGLAMRHTGRSARSSAVPSMRHPDESDSDVSFLLGALGRLWLGGVDVDWQGVHGPARRSRVPLPTYPFERQRYWVEPVKADAAGARRGTANKRADVGEWFYAPSWKRSPGPRAGDGSLRRGPWLLFVDAAGMGKRLGQRLVETGQDVVSVVPAEGFEKRPGGAFALNPTEPRDYTRLLESLDAEGRSPVSLVHLWGLGADELPRRALELGFLSLVHLGRALGASAATRERQLVVVTSGVQEVTGEEALLPDRATVLGPCKVIPQEYPGVTCRSIDLVAPGATGWDASLNAVFDELMSDSGDAAVAYRGGLRWVQGYEPWPLPAVSGRPRRLREAGVYLVTGGLGGIGLEVAGMLAREARARLVLVGRGALPARPEWESHASRADEGDELARRLRRLLALEELGAEVLALQADAADLAQMRRALAQAEAHFGAVHGVFHAAGAARAFLSVADTGWDEAEAQFRSRLCAATVLEQVLEGRKLDFCLLMSSLSAVLGGLGSAAYTGAHAFLDAFAARHNRRSGVPWQSVNWDRWNTWRDAPSEPADGEAGYFMTPAEALEALGRTLSGRPLTQLVVSTGDLQARIDRWIRMIAPEASADPGAPRPSLYSRPELAETYVAPRTATEKTLAAIWCDALGLEKVGVHDDFFDLGGDSVLGLRIVAKATEAGLRMTARQLLEHHTIAALAAVVARAESPTAQVLPSAQPVAMPSAFPGARLDAEQLDAFLTQLGEGGTEAK